MFRQSNRQIDYIVEKESQSTPKAFNQKFNEHKATFEENVRCVAERDSGVEMLVTSIKNDPGLKTIGVVNT